MQTLTLIFTIGTIIGLAMIVWFHTNSGKKWLRELDD